MHKEFLMGNEAIALGALAAGVQLVSGYPGTPSTEVLETLAKHNPGSIHVEWSINEKAALEVAAGAAYSGARSLVTMKQVGLNVASDPLMSLEYIGVKGGMVVLVADDPGPISSQTEQDTRTFAMYSKIPVFDPSSVQEAYDMIQEAFEFSEKYGTPVLLRPTTRIDHGYAAVNVKDETEYTEKKASGFIKDSSRWVIFPRLSLINHAKIEERNAALSGVLSDYEKNRVIEEKGSFLACDHEGSAKAEGSKGDAAENKADKSSGGIGIVAGGISFAYLMDCIEEDDHPRIMKISTPFPFPEELALQFLKGLGSVLVIEELDPVIERSLIYVCGKHGLDVRIYGKLSGHVKAAGENTVDEVRSLLLSEGIRCKTGEERSDGKAPALPVRPPVLCAGCPHRASFYAVKQAMKGEKTIYCGDIGCYTLGNAMPLDMCDTCLCMGAGIGIAQGVFHVEPDTKAFAFVGDSTFFASGITGTINGFYNQANLTLVILDNSTTAMTGHQPHPGTGMTMMGDVVDKVDISSLLKGAGIEVVETVNPLDHKEAVETVKRVSAMEGVKAIIFRYPCIVKFRPGGGKACVDPQKCTSCRKCIRELGCPGLIIRDGKAFIDETLCTGCTLCEQICPAGAISGGQAGDLNALVRQYEERVKEEAKSKKEAQGAGKETASRNALESPGAEAGADSGISRNILMCGVGGQGTILASKLIAACAMEQGIMIHSAETIGMAQRGGSVFSHLRLGDKVFSPVFGKGQADLMLGFEPSEAVRMLPYLKKDGTLVCSRRPVIPVSAMTGGPAYDTGAILDYLKAHVERLILVDTDEAIDALGTDKVMNVVLLGAAAGSGALGIDRDTLRRVIELKLPPKLHELNLRALDYYTKG